MIRRLLSAAAASALVCGNVFPATAVSASPDTTTFYIDSGVNYTETVGTIPNPGMGYTNTIWAVCKPGSTPVYSPTSPLVLFFIDIGAFSSGANGVTADDGSYTPGKDYDLDAEFFEAWKTTFENCRRNGCMIAVRFRYDANGKADPEPATFDGVLRHIGQLKVSGLFEEYKDILCFVESGFVGKWGEQHGGKYVSVEYKAKLLDAMLDCVPAPTPVTVRTPDTFAKWAGISRADLANYTPRPGSRASRVGLYDDGYMGSDSDLGTYSDRAAETAWLGRQTLTSYFGGEFSGDIDFAKKYDAYLPENCIPEMYKTHLSYINSNIFQLYKDYVFGADCDIEGVDNSAYYGQSVFQFIRDHIGYRFVLRESYLSGSVEQGGIFDLNFTVENTGFANPVPEQKACFLLERGGKFMKCASDISPNDWLSATKTNERVKLSVPGSLPAGDYKVYLKITEGENDISQTELRSVRFANDGVWDGALGANFLGRISVVESGEASASNAFRQIGCADEGPEEEQSAAGANFTVRGKVVVDGEISSPSEWPEETFLAEKDGASVSLTADEEYLYVMGKQSDKAKAPVYNIRATRGDGESFWAYFASNGYVYYNHNDYSGMVCKRSGDTVEYKIPLGLFGVKGGDKLKAVRLFLQDSAEDWKVLGDVTAENVEIPSSFNVYSAKRTVRLKAGEPYAMNVLAGVAEASYQWYKDGEELSGETAGVLTLQSPSAKDAGLYSVKIVSAAGTERTADIAEVVGVVGESSLLYGDADCDGEVKMNDAVLIMQSISNPDRFAEGGYEDGAITKEGVANADCYQPGSGITPMDALTVQQYLLELVEELPRL